MARPDYAPEPRPTLRCRLLGHKFEVARYLYYGRELACVRCGYYGIL